MIEPMKQVNLVCLETDKESALAELQKMAIIHLKQEVVSDSDELIKTRKRLEELEDTVRFLATRDPNEEKFDYSNQTLDLDPSSMARRVRKLMIEHQRSREELEHWKRAKKNLEPWGNFDTSLVQDIRAKGMDLLFCSCAEAEVPAPDGVAIEVISVQDGKAYFIAVSDREIKADLPVITVDLDHSMNQIERSIGECEDKIKRYDRELTRLSLFLPKVEMDLARVRERVDFLSARDGMGVEGTLVYLSGYVPASREKDLSLACRSHGWGMLSKDAAADDPNVPTLIKVPKWLQVSKPIFDFIGINPGYDEYDVSGFFLLFFTMFFGIIIGDGGYGLLFLIAAIACKTKFRKQEAQLPINLLMLLSGSTLIWGILTGNFFGIDPGKMPGPLQGLGWLTNADNGQEHVQVVCFSIAVVHLSIAHGWKALAMALDKKVFSALGQVGWLLFIWGAFLIIIEMVSKVVLPDSFNKVKLGLLAAGFVLMLLFSINWKDVGDILNFPFGALGGFVDILSYIRLFAVGLSSYYVAVSMNMMGTDLMQSGAIGMVIGIVVILVGHLLNIVLCAMGVLVHGIRLNTLEFSGHLGLEWKGLAFNPFRKRSTI